MSKSKKSKAQEPEAMTPETNVSEVTAPEAAATETAAPEAAEVKAAAPETAEAPEASAPASEAAEDETAEPAGAKTLKKLIFSIAAVIVLALGLCVTTFALTYAAVKVENNEFKTGEIKINLNDGKPVIQKEEYVFEPGMTVKKDFFIQNEGTWDVYYKIYLEDVIGGLANVLDITITDGDKVLYQGTADGLTRQNAKVADDTLKPGQRRDLTITFYYPPEKGNETQLLGLDFTISAEATQAKNNPDRQF